MALAVGGALESLYAEPGALDIIVQRRQASPMRQQSRASAESQTKQKRKMCSTTEYKLTLGNLMEPTEILPLTRVCVCWHQGFVRLAAETGAQIVPVISFGENDLFTAEPVKADTPFGKFQRCAVGAQHRVTPHSASSAFTRARVQCKGQARVLIVVHCFASYWAGLHRSQCD